MAFTAYFGGFLESYPHSGDKINGYIWVHKTTSWNKNYGVKVNVKDGVPSSVVTFEPGEYEIEYCFGVNMESFRYHLVDGMNDISLIFPRIEVRSSILKGEKGDKGDTGPRGLRGEKGEKGDTGPIATTFKAQNISDAGTIGRSVITALSAAAARAAINAADAVHSHTIANISDSTVIGKALVKATDALTARTAISAAASSHTHTTSDITDSTSTGKQLMKIADANSVRTLIAAAQSVHTHVVEDITNISSLGSQLLLAGSTLAGRQALGVKEMVTGNGILVFTASTASTAVQISFSGFSSAPKVFAIINSASGNANTIIPHVYTVTPTSAYVIAQASTALTFNATFDWIAIGI